MHRCRLKNQFFSPLLDKSASFVLRISTSFIFKNIEKDVGDKMIRGDSLHMNRCELQGLF